jgi:FG-GAP repeat
MRIHSHTHTHILADTGIQKGAAYVYSWDSSTSQWLQTQKLVNTAGSGTDRYGWSVAMHTTPGPTADYIAVGAPGELAEAGAVHVYMYSSSGGASQWNYLQTLTSQLYSSGPDQFGSALAVSDDTLVISAVGAAAGSGAVDIWSLSVGGVYQATQRITLSDGQPGDQFGFSISLYKNLLVIGCPGRSDNWLHTGRVRSATAGHATGAVYVYQRPDAASDFVLFEKLDASNVKPDDRLGHGVAVHAGVIVATSLQKINPSSVRYQRSVQVVEVQAARCCTGNTYRLGWRQSCSDSSSSSSGDSTTSGGITSAIDAAAARLTSTVSSSSTSSSDSGCRTVWSEPIQTDASAATVKAALEAAFGLGLTVTDELYVTRSAQNAITDGYAYTVVFVQHEGDVPQLLADYSVMTGPGATVTVATVNDVPDRLRGVAHVFQVSPYMM